MTTTTRPSRAGHFDRALATLALASFSLVVAIGFCRVFSGWSFLGDLLLVLVVGHAAGYALSRVHLAVALPAQIVVVAWVCAAVVYSDTFTVGVPTSQTWDLVTADLRLAGEQFSEAVAPVVYAGGWTSLAVIGVGVSVLLADLFAFRAGARFEALVPGGVLFVIVGALGDGRDQVWTTAALVLSGVVTVSALRVLQRRPARIVIGNPQPLRARIVAAALIVGGFTAVAAGLIGPRLPGAASDAVYDPGGGTSEVTRIESPLVDIRSRLVNQSDRELFTVTANSQSYWRIATLATFDGSRWKLDRSTLEGTARLGGTISQERVRQEIVIAALGGQLVPAAPEPVSAEGSDLRWSARNATLVVADDGGLERGDRIVVESVVPRYEPEQLDRATSAQPPDDDRYLAMPDDVPDSLESLAGEVTRDADTGYRKALAIQDWFRANFDYSLEVQQGHGNNAIESFLRLKIGYCEQFAGTFAAMARTLGLPARVAVGYTAGSLDEATGTYSVAGRNAHAWPEVWFDDLGWVAFEPTPGRGVPGAQNYTGVAPQQDSGRGTAEPAEGDGAPAQAPTTTAAPPVRPGASTPQEVPNIDAGRTSPSTPVVGAGGRGPDVNRIATPVVIGLVVIVLVAVAPAVLRRIGKRHIGADPRSAIVGIYDRLRTLVAAAGTPTSDAVTPREFARRAAQAVPGVRNDLNRITETVTASAFGPSEEIDASVVMRCEGWYANVESVAKTLLPWHVRLRRYLTLR